MNLSMQLSSLGFEKRVSYAKLSADKWIYSYRQIDGIPQCSGFALHLTANMTKIIYGISWFSYSIYTSVTIEICFYLANCSIARKTSYND